MTSTLGNLVTWIEENKRGNAFKGKSHEEIAAMIISAHNSGNLLIDINNKGEIFGVIIFTPCIYVEEILTTQKYSLNNLALSLNNKYPKHTAWAKRRGKLKQYNVTHLLRKL